MKSNIEKKLEDVNPKKMTGEEKSYMWSKIEDRMLSNEADVNETNTFSNRVDSVMSFVMRISFKKYALVPALMIAFIAGTMTSTFAFANESNPGDFLFPVDITAEKILLTLTFGDTNDEYQLQFAEERLDEVKELLALASIVGGDGFDDEDATSTDDGTNDDTSTSTDDDTNDDSNDDDESDDTINKIERAQSAFIVALNHLENARVSLLDKGNDLAVAVIDDMILELTALAENHIASLESYKIKIDEDNDEIKIALQVSMDGVKTKFKFEIDPDDVGNGTSLDISGNGSGSNIKLKDGEFKISQEVKDNSSNKNNGSKKPKKSDRVEICHISSDSNWGFGKKNFKAQTKLVSELSLDYYLNRGDTLGACDYSHDDDDGDDDDDNDDYDKKVKICHKDTNTIEVSKFAQWAHFGHGDSKGKCDDNDDDDGDDDDGDDDQDDTTAPTITNLNASVSVNTATVSWTTNENATSTIWFATTTPISTEPPTEKVGSDTLALNHSLILNNLLPDTKYYLVVEVTDEAGNHTQSLERAITTDSEPEPADETAPVISAIGTSDLIATSTNIVWTTDEDADSKVWYSISSPVDPSSPTDLVSSSSTTTEHSLTINGLTASTTYFYIVESKDNSGNVATSSEESFTTDQEPEPADETPPVISALGTSDLIATSTNIVWTTDEDADSKVWYSTSTPLVLTSSLFSQDLSLTTNHSLGLSSLATSTTYYFITVSSDSSGNIATSSEQSFNTLSE